tara:strand:+ start:604 stop:753 length:150 start_codon:yes stop_codon:yes gene_type:complete
MTIIIALASLFLILSFLTFIRKRREKLFVKNYLEHSQKDITIEDLDDLK